MPRPKLPKAARRVSLNARVQPATLAALKSLAARRVCSLGEALDQLVATVDQQRHALTQIANATGNTTPAALVQIARDSFG